MCPFDGLNRNRKPIFSKLKDQKPGAGFKPTLRATLLITIYIYKQFNAMHWKQWTVLRAWKSKRRYGNQNHPINNQYISCTCSQFWFSKFFHDFFLSSGFFAPLYVPQIKNFASLWIYKSTENPNRLQHIVFNDGTFFIWK